MRFLIDMPLPPQLGGWLREQGHDRAHASELEMAHANDEAILRRASNESRVVITADLDFSRLLAVTKAGGPGLVLFRGGNYSEVELQQRLERVLAIISPEDLPYCIVVIDHKRIRRRRLPIK
jgi:predicted nuclease of predicted toxin-antitoxin system